MFTSKVSCIRAFVESDFLWTACIVFICIHHLFLTNEVCYVISAISVLVCCLSRQRDHSLEKTSLCIGLWSGYPGQLVSLPLALPPRPSHFIIGFPLTRGQYRDGCASGREETVSWSHVSLLSGITTEALWRSSRKATRNTKTCFSFEQ